MQPFAEVPLHPTVPAVAQVLSKNNIPASAGDPFTLAAWDSQKPGGRDLFANRWPSSKARKEKKYGEKDKGICAERPRAENPDGS